jgi:ABC-type Fe3+-hydroxamate transport system substrate-binding protein
MLVCLAAGCRPAPPDARASIRDDFGAPLALDRAPARIVSLNPTTTEILFAIGAGRRLVGRSQYDVFPDSARLVPDLGLAIRPNVEALLAAHPDLVILYASADNKPAADRLRQAGIATAAFKIDSISTFARVTRLLGRLTGDSARAAGVVDSVMATLARVRAATSTLPRPTAFLHVWERPVIAIGGGSFMSELLDIAGARNIYASDPRPSLTVTIEDVVARDPDVVLITPDAAAKIRRSATWRTLRAVRDGHVLTYDTLLVARPSVQLGAAAASLAQLFHPGAVR